MNWKRVAALPAVPALAVGTMLAKVFMAAHRPDLPSFPNHDLSGSFGDPEQPRLAVVAIGDSNLTAPGVVDVNDAWLRLVCERLGAGYCVELTSLAQGGSRTRQVIAEQLDRAVTAAPDLAVISVGGNDALRVVPGWLFERQLGTLVARLHAVAGAVVVNGISDLGTIPRLPRFLAPFLTWRARRLDGVVTKVVARFPRATRIQCWGTISDALQNRDPREMFSADLFHPSETGHQVFMTEVIPAFEEAVALIQA